MSAFPQTALPNKLLQSLRDLLRTASIDVPLVEIMVVERAALRANSVSTLKAAGYTGTRKGEPDAFRRELGPAVVRAINRRAMALLQPALLRRWGIAREVQVHDANASMRP
mgnify:CR=1 FL=1